MKIDIRTIPHRLQRYPTVGDWYRMRGLGTWAVRVSEMSDWRYEFLVALHEAVEMALCEQHGIREAVVTEFDEAFEAKRALALESPLALAVDLGEPGDSPDAPYRREHRFAENIERQVAHELGVDWAEYEKAIGAL